MSSRGGAWSSGVCGFVLGTLLPPGTCSQLCHAEPGGGGAPPVNSSLLVGLFAAWSFLKIFFFITVKRIKNK